MVAICVLLIVCICDILPVAALLQTDALHHGRRLGPRVGRCIMGAVRGLALDEALWAQVEALRWLMPYGPKSALSIKVTIRIHGLQVNVDARTSHVRI